MTNDHAIQTKAHDYGALDYRYMRRLQPDPSGGYTATIHELPGCIAEGDTADEALANLESTALSWMLSAQANNYPVSPPVDYEGASGKIALRISKRLHQIAAERADLEGVSLNQFIGNALANYIGQQDGMARLARELDKSLQTVMHAVYVSFQYTRSESSRGNIFINNNDWVVGGTKAISSNDKKTRVFKLATVVEN